MGHEFVRWFAQQQVGPDPRELLTDAITKAQECVKEWEKHFPDACKTVFPGA